MLRSDAGPFRIDCSVGEDTVWVTTQCFVEICIIGLIRELGNDDDRGRALSLASNGACGLYLRDRHCHFLCPLSKDSSLLPSHSSSEAKCHWTGQWWHCAGSIYYILLGSTVGPRKRSVQLEFFRTITGVDIDKIRYLPILQYRFIVDKSKNLLRLYRIPQSQGVRYLICARPRWGWSKGEKYILPLVAGKLLVWSEKEYAGTIVSEQGTRRRFSSDKGFVRS